jgi:hypothetical protein
MASLSPLRRLLDMPGVADLEFKALMKPGYADPERRADYPEVDACSLAALSVTASEAEATPLPDDVDPIDQLSPREQADAFEAVGWDVTDDKRRPLRMLRQFAHPLWLAIHGVAGQLPHAPDDDEAPTDWASKLAQDAAKFRRR